MKDQVFLLNLSSYHLCILPELMCCPWHLCLHLPSFCWIKLDLVSVWSPETGRDAFLNQFWWFLIESNHCPGIYQTGSTDHSDSSRHPPFSNSPVLRLQTLSLLFYNGPRKPNSHIPVCSANTLPTETSPPDPIFKTKEKMWLTFKWIKI